MGGMFKYTTMFKRNHRFSLVANKKYSIFLNTVLILRAINFLE